MSRQIPIQNHLRIWRGNAAVCQNKSIRSGTCKFSLAFWWEKNCASEQRFSSMWFFFLSKRRHRTAANDTRARFEIPWLSVCDATADSWPRAAERMLTQRILFLYFYYYYYWSENRSTKVVFVVAVVVRRAIPLAWPTAARSRCGR